MSNDDSTAREVLRIWVSKGLKAEGKSQTELANKLGVGQSRISEMQSGKRGIKAHEIPKIAEYIEQPPPKEWLALSRDHNLGKLSDPPGKWKIRYALHQEPNLIRVIVFRDDVIRDEFDADRGVLEDFHQQTLRAIKSLSKAK